jgi:hypothetical protein
MTEHRQCTGTCGEDGAGRVLELTEENFYQRENNRGEFVFITRCRQCVAAVQLKRRNAARTTPRRIKSVKPMVVTHPAPRLVPLVEETAEERSARIVDSLIPSLPWELERT